MRIYKFRGFHPDEHGETVIKLEGKEIRGRWYKGDISTDGGYYIQEHSVLPETVGQFAGLEDSNGRKIFEGDIVESRASENKEDWKRWQVIFYDGSYCFERDNPHKRKHKHEQNLLSEDEIELYGLVVVGNIHDNPELLEVEE